MNGPVTKQPYFKSDLNPLRYKGLEMRKWRQLRPKYYAALGGIVSAAALIFTGCSQPPAPISAALFETTTPRPDEPPIAAVAGTYLYASDVARHAEAQNLIAPGVRLGRDDLRFDTALQELIDQRLLALGAISADVHLRGGVQRRISLARERILSSAALEAHLAKTVTEKSIKAAYDRQIELGRNTAAFDQSRAEIEALLTAEQVQQYVTFLRSNADIKILKAEETKSSEIENE